ncbi:SigE family RNA polymerase sigma factor [Micromonospora lupini]|uniref:SigE family RNA polymerase sigma factor n=1 Tax=Micromonospora lupini TaxID=285679 RepID=UPI0031CFAAD5
MASRDPLEEEFREFVAARSAALLRTAYLLAGDWATAEDLLQTALTKTYLAWKRLGGIEAVEPYARRVMVNTSTSWWRRRWHGERPTEVLPERPGVDEIEQQLDRDLLWRHLRELPNRQRAVLVLRYYEDMSEAQTAALLDISPGTVKSQSSRALATLRRRMGAATPDLADAPGPDRSANTALSGRGRDAGLPGRGRDAALSGRDRGAALSGRGRDAALTGRGDATRAGRGADAARPGPAVRDPGGRAAATPRPAAGRTEPGAVAPRPSVPRPIAPAVELPTAPAAVPVGTGAGDQQ